MAFDQVFVNGLSLDVRIGFHEYERHIVQRLRVDLAVETDFHLGPARDQHEGLVDYYELTRALQGHVASRSYDLIEALAEDLASVCVERVPAGRVRVRVTKRPMDMPAVESVAVECVRAGPRFQRAGP